MNVKLNYESSYDRYERLLNEHNTSLIQTISVSDEVSKEIFLEDYLRIQNELQIAEANVKSLEKSFLHEMGNELFSEYLNFYARQYINCSIYEAFNRNNVDLLELLNKYKMRPIQSLTQKRELCLLMNEIKRHIELIDYEGNIIDTIGKYIEKPASIIIRCRGIKNIAESIEYIPIIPII